MKSIQLSLPDPVLAALKAAADTAKIPVRTLCTQLLTAAAEPAPDGALVQTAPPPPSRGPAKPSAPPPSGGEPHTWGVWNVRATPLPRGATRVDLTVRPGWAGEAPSQADLAEHLGLPDTGWEWTDTKCPIVRTRLDRPARSQEQHAVVPASSQGAGTDVLGELTGEG